MPSSLKLTFPFVRIPIQHVTDPPDSQRNFLVVDSKTETSAIQRAFENFTQERKDIGIVLINQHVRSAPLCTLSLPFSKPAQGTQAEREKKSTRLVTKSNIVTCIQIAERIRNSVDNFTEAFPAVLEIPSKDHPYDPDKDSVLRRVRRLFGE